MIAALMAPVLLSGVFAAVASRYMSRIDPRIATWTVTLGSVVLTLTTTGSLGIVAWPLVARMPLVAEIGDWHAAWVGRRVPIPVAVSAAALAGLVWIAVRGIRTVVDFGRRLLSVDARSVDAAALVVLEDEMPVAYSLPTFFGLGGRTVVSTGLLGVLDAEERSAVLAHERAHVECGHHWFALALRSCSLANPFLVGVESVGLLTLERWADERAALTSGRSTTARAVAHAALARIAVESRRLAATPALLHAASGPVTVRVSALLAEPPSGSRGRWVLAGVAVGAVVALGVACHDMEGMFEALRRLS
jgi:Zn-dependent protease with chaperone function